MSNAKARIIARAIHRGSKSIDEVEAQYQDLVKEWYFYLFGEELV